MSADRLSTQPVGSGVSLLETSASTRTGLKLLAGKLSSNAAAAATRLGKWREPTRGGDIVIMGFSKMGHGKSAKAIVGRDMA